MNIFGLSRINYWHGIHGGMDVHGRILSEGLVQLGHQVSLICSSHPCGCQFEEKNGVRIFYLRAVPYGSRRRGWPSASASKVLELHRQCKTDIIWSQSFDGYGVMQHCQASKLAPMVLTVHGCIQQELKSYLTNSRILFRCPTALLRSFLGIIYSYFVTQRPLLKAANKILAVSSEVRYDLLKWYGRRLADKCVLVPNGVDTDRFYPDSTDSKNVRKECGAEDGETLLLSLGRLTHEKGHHLALEALHGLRSQRKKIRLLIVGDGNYRNHLQLLTKKLALESFVRFTGNVNNDEIVNFYNAADIVLMPTLTVEGMPFVLLEAMACQKPVIATRSGGIPSVIDNGRNGILIERGDWRGLAEAIAYLIDNPRQRNEIGHCARSTVCSGFSKDLMIDRVEEQMQLAICDKRK